MESASSRGEATTPQQAMVSAIRKSLFFNGNCPLPNYLNYTLAVKDPKQQNFGFLGL